MFCFFILGRQYQCNRLPGKTYLQNDLLCVKWDVNRTHSLSQYTTRTSSSETGMVFASVTRILNVKVCVKLILLSSLWNVQVMIAANDGLFDGPGFNSDESRLMSNCLHLLYRVLLTLFAWYVLTSYHFPYRSVVVSAVREGIWSRKPEQIQLYTSKFPFRVEHPVKLLLPKPKLTEWALTWNSMFSGKNEQEMLGRCTGVGQRYWNVLHSQLSSFASFYVYLFLIWCRLSIPGAYRFESAVDWHEYN